MILHLTLDIIIGGAILGAVYSLVAVGLNLQYGVTRILNVAHGEFLMIGAYLTYFCFTLFGLNPYASIIVIGPLMFLIGFVVYTTLLRGMVKSSKSGEELCNSEPGRGFVDGKLQRLRGTLVRNGRLFRCEFRDE